MQATYTMIFVGKRKSVKVKEHGIHLQVLRRFRDFPTVFSNIYTYHQASIW